jgi:hypothetical protein
LNTLHLSSIALGNLNFLSAWTFSSSSWTLLTTALFVGAVDELYLLIDLYRPETYSIRIDVSVGFHSTVDSCISKRVIYLKLPRFVCCWTRKFCFNVCSVHCFFYSIDMVKSWSFWRFFSCGFAFIVSSNCLRVALNDHWFKWWNFLFIIVFVDVGRRRIYTINNFTYILRSIISTLLRRVPSLIRFLFQIIFRLINTFFFA